jgi:hypothetical protein
MKMDEEELLRKLELLRNGGKIEEGMEPHP